MDEKKIRQRKFETVEALRGAIIRHHMSNSKTVIFVDKEQLEQIRRKGVLIITAGVWRRWPRVAVIANNDGNLLNFEEASDGEEMFFFGLDS